MFVVEDHYQILPFVHKAIRKKKLKFEHLKLIHVDAHPDMMVLNFENADVVFSPHELYEGLEKSEYEFVMPLVYAGHVNHIVWVKPTWAKQMKCGRSAFYVGKWTNGRMKVSSEEQYFVDDQAYAPMEEMEPKRKCTLDVVELPCEYEFKGEDTILDICLDYFSTWNPFLKKLKAKIGIEKAAKVVAFYTYPFFKDSTCTWSHAERSKMHCKFKRLNDSMFQHKLYQESYSTFRRLMEPMREMNTSLKFDTIVQQFYQTLCSANKEDIAMIEWVCEVLQLPEHQSNYHEIDNMLNQLKIFLTNTFQDGHVPGIITIARSAIDEYTPPEQVEYILTQLKKLLQELFPELVNQ